ncbi:MAG TPA: Flp pilus assembly protein CpaB [Rhizomicrobium sp.]|nr:Flp pilus assembly protein CpaB [Rhizomicrobium sp.]
MSIRTLATLSVAVLLGLIAVVLVRGYLSRSASQTAVQSGPQTVAVVVAAKPLPRGTILQADMLRVVAYPQDSAPAEAYRDIVAATSGPEQQRILLRSVVENEAILTVDVSGANNRLGLSGVVAPGMRAVSVRSNDVAGVGGFVLPGDRVDVMLTRTINGTEQNKSITQILAENVRVLGVDQSADVEKKEPVVAKSVTVEVTPDQAVAISLGQSVGTVSLSLRHLTDDAPVARKVITEADLSVLDGHGRPGRGGQVRVIRGIDSSAFSFAAGSGLKKSAAAVSTAVGAP